MSKPPSILVLFTDQQRFDTIAALGNPVIRTPALDSLVREGVAFTSAYTPSPVCVAARCSLVLGQWPHQTGCTANNAMPQERVSLMERVREAGYQTHGTGKMHFTPDSRKLWGFEGRDYSEECTRDDDFYGLLRRNGYDHIMDPQGVRSEYYYLPQPSQLPERLHNTTWVADRSLEFLQTRDRQRPFFLWSSFIKPHPPFESPVPWNRLYKPTQMPMPHLPEGYQELLTYWNRYQNRYKWRDRGTDLQLLRTMQAAYYAAISSVDYNVGRILGYLRQTGELDETMVIFTTDHGEMLGDFGSYGKRSMFDAAARIPFLVRYPEAFAAGERCERLASLVDVLPTCLGAAGIRPPEECVGEDLREVAQGKARDAVMVQYSQGATGLYGLVGQQWKYVYSAADGREWLYERGEAETRDRTGERPEIAARMRAELIARLRADGYEEPLEGDGWKAYPLTEVPPDPDAELLYQEGGKVEGLFPPGYWES
ncbi:MAG: sulfatase-like hydrolase/transferase [Armatimonadia bacterium]